MTTFVVEIDFPDLRLERPGYRLLVEASDADAAVAKTQRRLDRGSSGDVVRRAVALDDLLAPVRAKLAAGTEYVLSFKHEDGSFGPVALVDVEAAANAPRGVPFGTEPTYMVCLPWFGYTEAQALADGLGVGMEAS